MVARTYVGLGPRDSAISSFNGLSPYVVEMLDMQAECLPLGPDYMAMGIALDSLDTAAFHFTRRRDFYFHIERPAHREGNGRLKDPVAAAASFQALDPYVQALRGMQFRCRPFGADYMALAIALEGLGTAVYHFIRETSFYGSTDPSGPVRFTLRGA